jgi:predicted transcriptional regulator
VEVLERMSSGGAQNIPVMENGNLVGLITQSDLARVVQIAIETSRGKSSATPIGTGKS